MSAPGEVVRIRINPRDCMSVADVVTQVGLAYEGMSFSQAVSIALGALLETMRNAGTLPKREGFEFTEVMAPFIFKERTARKVAIARTFTYAGDDAHVPELKRPHTEHRTLKQESPAHMRLRLKFEQIDFKITTDPLNASQEERDEHQALARQMLETE